MGYTTIVGENTFSSNNTDEGGKTWRITIPASEISADANHVRLTFAHRGVTYQITKCYIGHQGASNDEDFDGNQVQVTFDGGSASKNINASDLTSDVIDFALDSSKDLVVSFYFGSYTYDNIPYDSSGWSGYQYGFDTTGDSAADTHPTMFTGPFNDGNGIVSLIEKYEPEGTVALDVEVGAQFDHQDRAASAAASVSFSADATLEIPASVSETASVVFSADRVRETPKDVALSGSMDFTVEALNWTSWLADNRHLAIPRYYLTLTGDADGETDLEIPIESFQMRLRTGDPSYLECIVPNVDDYLSDINARINGDLKLEMAWVVDGTESVRETLVTVDLDDARTDQGPRSESITLKGSRTNTPATKTTYLQDVTYRSLNEGKLHIRCAVPDVYLQPGDTAKYETDDFSDSFTVGRITCIVAANRQQMDVVEG